MAFDFYDMVRKGPYATEAAARANAERAEEVMDQCFQAVLARKLAKGFEAAGPVRAADLSIVHLTAGVPLGYYLEKTHTVELKEVAPA